MGLMLSGPDISSAQGPALLYAANLLGILIGGITVLAIREPYFRDKLRRRRRSRLPVLLALGLAVVVGQKLYGRYEQYRYRLNREVAQKQIESEIRYYLKNETLIYGANDAVELEKVVFDWPDYWEQKSRPKLPGGGAITRPQAAELQTGSEHSRHDQQQTCRTIPWP